MEQNQLAVLITTLDSIRHQNGADCWYARELYPLLSYVRWENFETAINRAKDSRTKTGASVEARFRDITKTVTGGMGLEKPIKLDK